MTELKNRGGKTLKGYTPTRWGSAYELIMSVLEGRNQLQALCLTEEEKTQRVCGDLVLSWDTGFWSNAKIVASLLKPLKDAIAIVEGDNFEVSCVLEVYNRHLHDFYSSLIGNKQVLAKVLAAVEHRHEQERTPVSLAANFLDPLIRGRSVRSDERLTTFRHIVEMAAPMEGFPGKKILMNELDLFDQHTGPVFGEEFFKTAAAEHLGSVSRFWEMYGVASPLTPVAKKITTIPATSASVERIYLSDAVPARGTPSQPHFRETEPTGLHHVQSQRPEPR